MSQPQISDWVVSCTQCGSVNDRVAGAPLDRREFAWAPTNFLADTIQIRPIEAATNFSSHVMTIPLATQGSRRRIAPGSSEATEAVAKITGSGKVRTWQDRDATEQEMIRMHTKRQRREDPDYKEADAEAFLVENGQIQPFPAAGDDRVNSVEALQEASVITRLLDDAVALPAPAPLASAMHVSRVPVTQMLVGYSRVAFEGAETALRFYTRAGGGKAQLAIYYDTLHKEGILLRFPDNAAWTLPALHAWMHAIKRALAESGGLGETALGECLFPMWRMALIYPTTGNAFNLELLKGAWRHAENVLVRARQILEDCPADPFCRREDRSCAQCLVLPFHECDRANDDLDRVEALRTAS